MNWKTWQRTRRQTPTKYSGLRCMIDGCLWWQLLFCFALMVGPFPVIGGSPKAVINNCDIQKGPCTQILEDRNITLEVLPRPVKAMKVLTFKVSVDGATVDMPAPSIHLNMLAMDMGRNRVHLKLNAQGIYEGRGVIVRCRSGLRTWKATVSIDGLGSVAFIFDVIY